MKVEWYMFLHIHDPLSPTKATKPSDLQAEKRENVI